MSDNSFNFEGNNNGTAVGENNGIINNGTIINHFDQRYNLKDRYEKGNDEFEYSAYCVGKFGNKAFKGCLPVTFINLHSNNRFMYDHIHINVPKDWYSELYFDNHIMKFKAKIKPYSRGNGTEDYGLIITEVFTDDSSNHTCVSYSNALKFHPYKIDEETFEIVKNILENEYQQETIAEFTIRLLTMLDSALASIDQSFYTGFITNFILTQYFLNTSLNEQCNQLYMIRQLDREVLLDLSKIISSIIINLNVNSDSMYKYKDIFNHICYLCNYIQNIDKDTTLINNKIIYEKLKSFGYKINQNDTKKMFDKIKKRHKDFGFKYPDNEEELEKELWINLLSMAHHLGYVDILV